MRVGFVVVAVVAARGVSVRADSALDKAAFTATPSELLALAQKASKADDVTILREDEEVRFDDHGRRVERWRLVFVVRTQSAADDWRTLGRQWRPFYQDKPVVRARVVAPDGKVTELDPQTITDTPRIRAGVGDASDRRDLEAVLSLSIGSVVEQQVTTSDRVPIVAAGGGTIFNIGTMGTTDSTRISFSVPTSRKVHRSDRGIPAGARPTHDVAKGRETWTYTIGPTKPTELEVSAPTDVMAPYAGIATATTWSAIARELHAMLAKRIAAGPVALANELPRGPTLDSVRAIAGWVQHQIRYDGRDLSSSTLEPATPAEVAKRGSGDALARATLLAALLGQIGVRADVALVVIGPGPAIPSELPRIEDFDHVLVRVRIDKTDSWIDVNDDALPAGRLPSYDQGRPALVIADDTTALIATPVAAPADNTIREVRTFELAEEGPARIIEVSREGGIFEASSRRWIRDNPADEVRKQLGKYVENKYLADGVESYTSTTPDDLTKPFELTVVASHSGRADAGRGSIAVFLFPGDALQKLPTVFTSTGNDQPARIADFVWDKPHIYEIENRLVIPDGFTMPAAAPDLNRELGTMHFVARQRVDGRTLVVTFRLDTGKLRITPAELVSARQAIRDLHKEDFRISIANTAWMLTDKHQYSNAITEANRMIRLHPREALHHKQLAQLLISMGAGEAARREARKAVELEPKSADAFVVLGWVLVHDTLGRQFGFDYDRAGARAAYEQARKLNPKHAGAGVELATLLERDQRGWRFERGADLRGAIAVWRDVEALDPSAKHVESLIRALLWSGDVAEAERATRSAPAFDSRDALLVAAIGAGAGGGKAAIDSADTLATGSARSTLLTSAGGILLTLRSYEAARLVFAETGLRAGTQQAALIEKVRRHDAPFKAGKRPEDVVIDMELSAFEPTRATTAYWDPVTANELRDELTKGALTSNRDGAISVSFLEDVMRSAQAVQVDGDGAAWRVDVTVFGSHLVVYVALDHDVPKIIGTSSTPAGAGRHVLRLLARKDEPAARRLLDWLLKDAPNHGLQHVWGTNLPHDGAGIELAGAIVASTTDPDRSLPVVSRCGATTTDGQLACDLIVVDIDSKLEHYMQLEEFTAAWVARLPKLPVALLMHGVALTMVGRFDEADKQLDDLLALEPDDRFALRAKLEVALGRGNLGEAIRRGDPLVKQADAQDLNNIAWLGLFEGSDLQTALGRARDAVHADAKSKEALNTLAAIEIELGDLGAGKEDGWKAMAEGAVKPGPGDWYVVGRLLEQLGFRDDALAAYRQIGPTKRKTLEPHAYELAQKRLKALGVHIK